MDSSSGIHCLKDHTDLQDRFTNMESKAQRAELTCSWSRRWWPSCDHCHRLFPPNHLEALIWDLGFLLHLPATICGGIKFTPGHRMIWWKAGESPGRVRAWRSYPWTGGGSGGERENKTNSVNLLKSHRTVQSKITPGPVYTTDILEGHTLVTEVWALARLCSVTWKPRSCQAA